MKITRCCSMSATVFLTALLTSVLAEAELLLWDSLPLQVSIPVGSERTLRFPASVREVRLPQSLDDRLRTQAIENSVHWLAAESFATQRVIVETAAGNNYLFDLRADAAGARSVIEIVRKEDADSDRQLSSLPVPVTLVRHAAMQLFAPRRFLSADPPIRSLPDTNRPLPPQLLQGVDFEYRLLGMWSGYGHFVTAVAVRNLSELQIVLDPRTFDHSRIRGNWLTSTFQHRDIQPRGSGHAADTSVLYLVSSQPFFNSIDYFQR